MSLLKEQLWEFVRAGFAGLWIQTHEAREAILEIGELSREQQLQLWTWNLDGGLQVVTGQPVSQAVQDPLSAVRLLATVASEHTPQLLVLENFHRFIDSPEVCQALLTQIHLGKQLGRHIIILSPTVKLPSELERHFVVLEHPLPSRDQLWEIASSLAEGIADYSASKREGLLDAAAGLTCSEAESAFSLSLVRHGSIQEREVWELKSRWLKKSGLLQLHQGQQGFDALGGLQNLKEFCRHSLRRETSQLRKAKPRGIMLLGVPGTQDSRCHVAVYLVYR
jgi:hypothetical protein